MLTLRTDSAPPLSAPPRQDRQNRQDSAHRRERSRSPLARLFDYLPRGNMLDDAAWRRRHAILKWLLLLHLPVLYLFGVLTGNGWLVSSYVITVPAVCLILGDRATNRRLASMFITAGLVYCSAALVGLSDGRIEAHFHFFIMIGFIALYQDWVPFLWNVVFTVLSHGLGSAFKTNLMFNHHAAQDQPWLWSLIHGVAVLFACVGVVMFWRTTEDEQNKTIALGRKLADADIARFTSELLVNLARRNQSMLYQQLDILNQLEEQERDPDALSELFRLDHLATRIRRNAESLLVLSGEEPPRVWSKPVRLVDVVRAAIAETEDLNRVTFLVDERLSVLGHSVTGLTHLLAELAENAVRFSPPESNVAVRTGPDPSNPGGYVLTVEDWGVGMRPEDMAAANEILADPQDVNLSASQRLGLHVVARLGQRHEIKVRLTPTPGSGVTAVVVLPPDLFGNARATSPGPGVGVAPQAAQQTTTLAAPVAPAAGSPPWGAAGQRRPVPPSWVASPVATPGQGYPPSNGYPAGNGYPSGNAYPASNGYLANGTPASGYPGGNVQQGGHRTQGAGPVTAPATARWRGWWGDAVQPRHEAAPGGAADRPALPRPVHGASPPEPVAEVLAVEPDAFQLNRRRPQAHLAPELRRSDQEVSGVPATDAARARDALSRYQASRQAARGESTGIAGDEPGQDSGTDGGGWR